MGFIIGSASKDGATFEGWLKFIRSYNEEEGWNIDLVTDDNSEPTIYEGNDLLNCTGDAGDVIYVAKYAENTDIIDYINYVNEEYLWNDGGEGDGENDDPRIEFEGNGGTFTVTVNSEETFDEVQGHEFPLSEDHQTIGDCLGYATISEVPDYWTERPFLGWNIYKRIEYNEDGESWTERDCLTDKPVTMEQVLRFEIDPNGIYYVSAEWEGRESDYYSSLYVHANGGNVTITRHESEGDTFTTSDWETDRIRNDGETRFDEANVSIGDANKEGAEFEGWLEFRRAYVEVDGFEMQQVNLVTEVDADGNITFTDPKDMLDRTAAGGDLIYIAKYSDTTLEDCIQFANDCYIWDDAGEGDGDWGDEGDEDYVPEDTILVEYWSYNETGEYEFTALARYIDGVSTYRDLLESMEAEVQHYEGMSTPSYEYNGGFNSNMDMYWDGVDLDSPAVGGLRLNAVPTYDEWLLKTDVIYYGADNEAQTDTQYIVVDKVIDNGDGTNRPSTYNDVIKLATIPEADDHSQDLGFKNEWEYSVTEGQMLNNWVDVSNLDAAISVDDPYYNNMLRVVAKYEKYDLTFTYNYLDKDGNVKTVSEDKLVPADYSISSYFTGLELNDSYQAVDEEDDVQDIKWQIHPWWGFTDEPTVDLPEIIASAQ